MCPILSVRNIEHVMDSYHDEDKYVTMPTKFY